MLVNGQTQSTYYTTFAQKKKVTTRASLCYHGEKGECAVRLGLSTAAFYGRWETEEAAAQLSRLPIDCAEAFLQTPGEYGADFGALVKQRLGSIPCTSVHPMGTQFENQLHGRSPRQRRDALDVLRRVLDAAAALGAGVYVYHGRSTPLLSPLPWNLPDNLAVLSAMREEAAPRGVTIAWENVCWCQLTTARRVREARQAAPWLRFTLDIKQAMRAGGDPVDMAHAMGEGLCNVHVCDWDAQGKLCLPGEGVFDFAALFRALREIGYRGPVILEPYLALIGSDEALLRALSHLRACMKTD